MTADKQPEALRLAGLFEAYAIGNTHGDWAEIKQKRLNAAADELRRLHAENAKLKEHVRVLRSELIGASNYIDLLGGISNKYRFTLEATKD